MAGFDRSPRLGAGDFARIGLAVPAVAVALASVAYLCQAGLADILYLNGARGDRVMRAWTLANSWPANVVSGALLAAILVAGFLWALPAAHRSYLLSAGQPSLGRVGLYAVVVLCGALGVAWGGNWTHGADRNWLHFNFWPPVMGLSVLAGALAPFWLARRADRARPATDGGTCSVRRTTASLDMIRIGLMMPCALVAAAAVEVLVVKYARIALDLSGNRDWERALYASAFWLASPLMAAAFVATLRACAPPTRRAAVTLGAGGVVVLWGALLVAGSAYPWTRRPDLNGWALAMGPATWLCGAATLWLLGRRVQRGVEARTTD